MTRTIESHETALTLINNEKAYGYIKPVLQEYALKLANGNFDTAKAVNGFTRAVSNFVNSDIVGWKTLNGTWKPTMADRKLAAAEMLEYYSDQIREQAEDMVGPEWVQVLIKGFSSDNNGNPTARHLVFSSTEEGGMVKRLSASWEPRRAFVGYDTNALDESVPSEMAKAGVIASAYSQISIAGSGRRGSDGEVVILFKRNAIKVGK